MRRSFVTAGLFALCLGAGMAALPAPVMAGPIERACLNSDRRAANRQICGCIQEVADMTLRGGDQRRAARFFSDPDEAQSVRMSTTDRDNAFWDRYRAFIGAAETYCGRGS